MIVTLTLNPSIDKSTDVEQLIPEKKLRCSDMIIEAGGGGINVSKAVCELGGETTALFPCGGMNGKLMEDLLSHTSIKTIPISIKGNTRENIVVNERSTNKQYKFIVPGPRLDVKELDLIKLFIEDLNDASFLVCSGSLPPNVPDSFLAEIASIAKKKKIKFVVDTSGIPLIRALNQGVYLIKPNLSELCFLSGKKYLQPPEIDDALDQILLQTKCEVIVVSMGPAGAILATGKMKKKYTAPVAKKMGTVGAGDSMVAGIIWMLEQNKSLEEAVQFGIACGTAATASKGTQLFKKEDALQLYQWVQENC